MKKRVAAVILAAALCLGVLPAGALGYAEDFLIQDGVLIKYTGDGGVATVPSGVTAIGEGAFSGCYSLTRIELPDGVTSIGRSAFSGCGNLEQIELPDSVTSIREWAFYSCTSLTQINIPDGVTSIVDDTFRSCTSLTQIQLPDSVTSIGTTAFSDCYSLTQVELPDSVTSIGASAFSACISLTKINIPNGVTSIKDFTFDYCGSLTQISIPGSVTSIGIRVFSGCESLTRINIPSSVTSIGEGAFYGCPSVTIYGQAGSCAEKYAGENGIAFGVMSDPEPNPAPAPAPVEDAVELLYTRTLIAAYTEEATGITKITGIEGICLSVNDHGEELRQSDISNLVFYRDSQQLSVSISNIQIMNAPNVYGVMDVNVYFQTAIDPAPGKYYATFQYRGQYYQSNTCICYDGNTFDIDMTNFKKISAPAAAPPAESLTANPTASTVYVNGQAVAFDAYNINGNNYFKLRDLAYILSGTEKQFEVGWDSANNAISLTSGKAYTAVGGEMTGKGAGNKTPTPTSSKIYLDGKEVQFTAYTIDGNNYFKLRDIGLTFDFGVTWDGANNAIVIDTGVGYTPE